VRWSNVYHMQAHFWTPQEGLSERAHRDRAPYDVWAKQGFITATPGRSVDYAYIAKWLVDFCDDYRVKAVKFDRWRIDVLQAELKEYGANIPLEPFGQGFKDMTPALDVLEGALVNGEVRHGGNPVLTMCAANAIAVRDPAGNRKLDKAKSTGRIDGMVAAAMALGAAAQNLTEPKKPLLMFTVGGR
jgi:phage terminase large subunit-like protein